MHFLKEEDFYQIDVAAAQQQKKAKRKLFSELSKMMMQKFYFVGTRTDYPTIDGQIVDIIG